MHSIKPEINIPPNSCEQTEHVIAAFQRLYLIQSPAAILLVVQ